MTETPGFTPPLPSAVGDLARRLGAREGPAREAVRLTQAGAMRGEARETFRRFSASQTIRLDRCAFRWQARTGPLGLVKVTDAFIDGLPTLEVTALGFIPLAHGPGDASAARGEIMRYLAELGAQATALGVGEYWQATVSRADVREVYAISDLILQLSDHPESFGRTVAEALHQGRPVLGWDLGGVGEQLRACFAPGAVPLGDHAALADRAAELLDHPQPDKIRREAIPTVETMQRATLAVYAELLGNPQATVIAS